MNADNWWVNALWSIIPTLCLGLTFWFIIFSIIRADRSERRAYARIEAEERARFETEKQNADASPLPQTELPDPSPPKALALRRPPIGFPFSGRGSGNSRRRSVGKGGVSDGAG